MPLPTPNDKEDKNTFMGRCMGFMAKDNASKPKDKQRPQNQMVAMCFSQYRQMHGGEQAPSKGN